ncbi:MAG: FAD binding domain-containing protein [Phycisphaerales bacterium]
MRVILPSTLHHALTALADNPALVPIAGGTDLFVHWPQKLAAHDHDYLDLFALTELRPHHWSDTELTLGALTTYWDIATDPRAARELPLLVAAARQVGAVQIQSRGTFAGNIANASPAADGVLALMALEAHVTLASQSTERSIPLSDFYTGYKQTLRRPGELLTHITIPLFPRARQVFEKVGARQAQAITKVGLALVEREPGRFIVAANSVAPTVRRCPAVEALLAAPGSDRSAPSFARALDADISPIDDLRSTAHYRRTVLSRLLVFACR